MIQPTSMRGLTPVAVPRFGESAEAAAAPGPRRFQAVLEQFRANPKSFDTWTMGGIKRNKDGTAQSGGFTAKTADGRFTVSYSLTRQYGIVWTEQFTASFKEQTPELWSTDEHSQTRMRIGFSRKALEENPGDLHEADFAAMRAMLDRIARKPIGFLKDA